MTFTCSSARLRVKEAVIGRIKVANWWTGANWFESPAAFGSRETFFNRFFGSILSQFLALGLLGFGLHAISDALLLIACDASLVSERFG